MLHSSADRRRQLPRTLLPIGIVVGLAAEWISYDAGDPAAAVADFAVGVVLITCGVVASERRGESWVGALMTLTGFTWFLGNFAEPALYVHRGPLVHLLLAYPTGRLTTRLARGATLAAYVVAAIEPLARTDAVTVTLGVVVVGAAARAVSTSSGTARRARLAALAAALVVAAVLVLGAVERVAGWDADRVVLWTYDVAIAGVGIGLLLDLLRGRWTDAVVTGLVVDLGPPGEVGTVRTKLARALDDPSLVLAYRLGEEDGFVDDTGRAVELPAAGSGRVVTPITDGNEQVAILVHDDAVLADRKLIDSVAAAARIAVANARLQAEARARAVELDASRRRIVEAANAERRRLEDDLRHGPERRLQNVAATLARARTRASATDAEALEQLETELADARRELREFAHAIHPAPLTEGGLMSALALLAARSGMPVTVKGNVGALADPLAAALYFVCSEALANVSKHARASRVAIEVAEEPAGVSLTVADDGVGGATLEGGSGLRGLADRVEALGGTFSVGSPPGAGTRVTARLPAGT